MSGYIIFDSQSASRAYCDEAEQLEKLFLEFPYIGPLSCEGSPFLLIETDLGECTVSCSRRFSPTSEYSVSIQVQEQDIPLMTPHEAIWFLRNNGAKSDWVKR